MNFKKKIKLIEKFEFHGGWKDIVTGLLLKLSDFESL